MNTNNGTVLVVGAGIGGIRSALDLAELGRRVVLIDKSPKPGGILSQLDHQFPNDHCGMCRMLPMFDRDSASQYCLRKGFFHRNVDLWLSTELVGLEGEPGKFKATLRRAAPLVERDRCIGCGECARVCPVTVPDEFNAGLSTRKAIYLPVCHNTPNGYLVDTVSCIQCGKCQEVCPTGAVELGLEARKTFRVLVVDDELIVRDSMKEWLEDEGFDAEMAGSGREAVEKLSSGEYGLMLLDVKMPGMDGVEVLQRAKELHPDLPVVMMTAYATVETAVEAMKHGARDYLMKPFDPEMVMKLVRQQYEITRPSLETAIEVGAVVFSGGFGLADPSSGNNTYGYREYPGVVTSVEFERILSGSGPTGGKLVRPEDGREIRKIAWLQCAGSRNIAEGADYCSSICCMFSVKEALLAKDRLGDGLDAAIFYMDMRTFGKDHQRYRESAEKERGVRFIRSRVHTVDPTGPGGPLRIVYYDPSGASREETFDLVVLATGQRPPNGLVELAERAGFELDPNGFCSVKAGAASRSSREGIFAAGSFAGARDICDSVIQSGSASLGASVLLASKGQGPAGDAGESDAPLRDVTRELPRVGALLCTCSGLLSKEVDAGGLAEALKKAGGVSEVMTVERLCGGDDFAAAVKKLRSTGVNRVLVGGCLPHAYGVKPGELAREMGLQRSLVEWVDVITPVMARLKSLVAEGDVAEGAEAATNGARSGLARHVSSLLDMGAAKLREAEPRRPGAFEVVPRALVVGGGIAGMTAALAIADHGFEVDLVEKTGDLGGNLRHLQGTLQGFSPKEMLEKTASRVEGHPKITVYRNARVLHSEGPVGDFLSAIELEDGTIETLAHGAVILATGGVEARPALYGLGGSSAVVTQHELEAGLASGAIDPKALGAVVMIQCVGSREEPRNYCSRVCCSSALKNSRTLLERNPDLDLYVLYRDMMSYGFLESAFTRARREGVIFIQYSVDEKPVVEERDGKPTVTVRDPVLERPLTIPADLLVLSTGVVPEDTAGLVDAFHVERDRDGFVREADPKWRPADTTREGIFVCGMAHSPRSIEESVAMAEAAAQRALGIIGKKALRSGAVVAEVRRSLCSLCERCLDACPYGVRSRDPDEDRIVVDEAACQGCGSCAAVCPNGASVLRGCQDRQLLAMIDAAIGDLL